MKKIYEELLSGLEKKNNNSDYVHVILDTEISQVSIIMKVLYLNVYPDGVEIGDENCEISIGDKNWIYDEDEDGYFSTSKDGTVAIFVNYSANLN